MARTGLLAAFFLTAALAGLGAHAQEGLSVEAFSGAAYNFKTRLDVEQNGFSTRLVAEYETDPFETPIYYAVRAAYWQEGRAWELSMVHHKLYLKNEPPGIENFSVSHGFNILTLNRAFQYDGWIWRIGLGPVITHTEATVNGVSYDGPYELAGAGILAGISRRFYFKKSMFLSFELLGTAAYAETKPDGDPRLKADISNVALHGQIGVGLDF